MQTPEQGLEAKLECPRCGVIMQCAWAGNQTPTPNMKDAATPLFKPKA
jgi:hypothetical protein